MSAESCEWLNGGNILVGYSAERGAPWWYDQELDGKNPESVLYAGAIPAGDIQRRLFSWEPVEGTSETTYADPVTGERVHLVIPDAKQIIRPDTRTVFRQFSDGYRIHGYNEWLVENLADILRADGLGAASAGLLEGGAIAWVQVQFPGSLETEGIEHRPFILATTSLNGKSATHFVGGTQLVVCDNTRAVALAEKDRVSFTRKHTSGSLGEEAKDKARKALELIHATAEEFEHEIRTLVAISVSDQAWDGYLDLSLGERPADGRARTFYDRKREALGDLYFTDKRVAPYKGTGWGVIQAVNTYDQHEGIVRGMSREERNYRKMVTPGYFEKLDGETLAQLNLVLAA
jgi:phage/plasmid-like protein (TIGR03299 family)